MAGVNPMMNSGYGSNWNGNFGGQWTGQGQTAFAGHFYSQILTEENQEKIVKLLPQLETMEDDKILAELSSIAGIEDKESFLSQVQENLGMDKEQFLTQVRTIVHSVLEEEKQHKEV